MQVEFHLQVYSATTAEKGVLIQFSMRTADSSSRIQVTPKKHANAEI